MQQLPTQLTASFEWRLDQARVPQILHLNYHKWAGLYIYVCIKLRYYSSRTFEGLSFLGRSVSGPCPQSADRHPAKPAIRNPKAAGRTKGKAAEKSNHKISLQLANSFTSSSSKNTKGRIFAHVKFQRRQSHLLPDFLVTGRGFACVIRQEC
jgi:hypothetical protein